MGYFDLYAKIGHKNEFRTVGLATNKINIFLLSRSTIN